MGGFVDLSGQKFNRLTVLDRAPGKSLKVKWRCACDCGNEVIVIAGHLKNGNTKSCGCQKIESSRANGLKIKHGLTGTSVYKAWQSMKDRCTNPDNGNYANYGGRGIQVCPEWMMSFEAFYRDMGPKPSRGHSIERIDVDGGYHKGNCKWATIEEQSNNKRRSRKYLVDGHEYTIAQLAKMYDIPVATLSSRLNRYGFTIDQALSKQAAHPVAHYNGATKRLHEWSAELGIPYLKIYHFVATKSPNLEGLVKEMAIGFDS